MFYLHRVDSKVPLEESLLFLKEMQAIGKIKHIGLSEVSIEQIETARKIVEVVAVQNQYNVHERKHDAVIDYCEKEGIIFVPWDPLASGLLTKPVEILKPFMQKYQATPTQLALAWLLHRSPCILPIPGSTKPAHIKENRYAISIQLTKTDYDKLSKIES